MITRFAFGPPCETSLLCAFLSDGADWENPSFFTGVFFRLAGARLGRGFFSHTWMDTLIAVALQKTGSKPLPREEYLSLLRESQRLILSFLGPSYRFIVGTLYRPAQYMKSLQSVT
jgi:hypothetical protein